MKKIYIVIIVIVVLLFGGYLIITRCSDCFVKDICEDKCGDGECQRIVCQGTDCPCAEDINSCPLDCVIQSFEECVEAGNAVMESYPRQCRTEDGRIFTEYIGNELEKIDLIKIDNPRPNQEIESPIVIEGQARGYWFFEASFPVFLVNWDGLIIAQGIAEAQSDWMTEDFVSYKVTLEFEKPEYSDKGVLILKKDNPSGLPEHDDALEIPIIFK
jgi:hypothetical protein